MYRYIFSIIFSFLFLTIGLSQYENEILDIYTIEDDSTYSLIMDHNHKINVTLSFKKNDHYLD